MDQMIPYLEDGQIAPQISEWQVRLHRSAEEVLSVLSSALQEADLRPIEERLESCRAEFLHTVCDFCDEIAKSGASIPLPRGFFVGEKDRKDAYAAVCKLLLRAEEHTRRMRQSALRLSLLSEEIEKNKKAQNNVLLLVCVIRAAAEANQDAETMCAVDEMRDALDTQGASAVQVEKKFFDIRERIQMFCMQTVKKFCERMMSAADMEHDGAHCDPVRASGLCGELRAAAEEIIRTI